MNEIKEIKIDLKDNSYKIFINDDIEKILINSIEKILSRPRVFIITDENVAGFILPKIKKIFEDGGIKTKSIIIQSVFATALVQSKSKYNLFCTLLNLTGTSPTNNSSSN